MKNNVKDLLPIGSIVLLSGATKKTMIFGVKQTDKGNQKEYDYIGVVYPEGNMGDGTQFFFDHNAVEQVIYRGYENDERADFIEKLNNFYEKKFYDNV